MAIDLGDVYRLAFTLTSPAGAPVNGGTVTVTVSLPDGTTTSPVTVSPDSTGFYHYDYQTVQAGRHVARWVSSGTNPGALTDAFDVRSASPPYIISLSDAKAQVNMGASDDDEELRVYVEAATHVIERHLGQAVVRRTFTEECDASGGYAVLSWPPVVSITSMTSVDGAVSWDPGSLRASSAGVVTATAGLALTGRVMVTYVAGLTEVPANYGLAARIIVQHLWQTQRGSAGSPGVGGLETPGAGSYSYGYAIPNRAIELLGPQSPLVA